MGIPRDVLRFAWIEERWRGRLATLAMGLLVELEEGATGTGNCRLADVLPDAAGALIAAVVLLTTVVIYRRARGIAR